MAQTDSTSGKKTATDTIRTEKPAATTSNSADSGVIAGPCDVYMETNTMNDRQLDDRTDKWLQSQMRAGRLSREEYDAVSLDRESSGCARPEWKEWVGPSWIVGLTIQECEIYSNYPAWTIKEIASRLDVTKSYVKRALARVRRMYQSLQNDPVVLDGLPNLSHMVPIDSGSYEDTGEDEIRF